MKAWHVASYFEDYYGSHLLVIAETRAQARRLAFHDGPWGYETLSDVKVRRAKEWDGMYDKPCCIEDNLQIVTGYPKFYGEEY